MGLVMKAGWLTVRLFLTFLFLESCHTLPPYRPVDGNQQEPQFVKRPRSRPTVPPKTVLHGHQGQHPNGDEKVYSKTKPITVLCHDAWMEIVVKADMYNTGVLIDGDDLRLGGQTTPACGARQSAAAEYTIIAALSDCGTQHLISDDSVIYTNLLLYSPTPSTNGIIRMEAAVLPIECHYRRRYGVSSSVLSPTWIPFASTQSAGDVLGFSLRLMNSDWLYEKTSDVYFLGEMIYIEASVTVAYHMPLRMFVDSCVATVFPDKNSVPRYSFIENNGCLTDARQTDSNSQFLPRVQDDRLHFSLAAFRFHQDTGSALYISCHLRAVPVVYKEDSRNRACSFINGSWRSVDENDWICEDCERPSTWEQPIQSGHHGLERELSLHPLKVFPSEYGVLGPRRKPTEREPLETKVLRMSDDADRKAQESQPMTPTSEEGIDPVDSPGEHDGTWPVEFGEEDATKELEKETTPGPRGPPVESENSPVDPLKEEDGSHLGEPLAKEEEEEGSGIMDMVYVGRKDQENESTSSPVVHSSEDDANPDVSSNEEPVELAVLPSLDANATVVPSNAENPTVAISEAEFSPADLTSEEDANPTVPPDEPTLNETLAFTWEEDMSPTALSDEGNASLSE